MFDGFYNPALQWLVIGALAPIIIHLATRSRPKPTPFPALRFILASHRRSSAKFKLKQFLLLLLRVLALAMFAYVVARPRAEGTAATTTRARTTMTAVILLDNSYSMSYSVDGVSRFDRARQLALETVSTFEIGESRGCLLLVNDSPQPVIADFDHAYDLDSLKEAIEDAELSHRSTSCTAAVSEAVRMLKGVNGVRKSVFLFTDLSRQAWPSPVDFDEEAKDVSVFVVDVGEAEPHNPAVLKIAAPPHVAPGNPFEVRTRVDARGAPGRQIELHVDGQKRSQTPANAHRLTNVRLEGLTQSPAPEHWGAVRLTGADGIEIDNARYFTFRSRPTTRVIAINGSPSGVKRRDELFFLRTALGVAPSEFGDAPVELVEMSPADLEQRDLPTADVLILCNVAGLSTSGWTKVRTFVSTGRALMVFGGDKVQPASYEPLAAGDTPLLPCRVGPSVVPPEPAHLEPGRLRHPLLQVWRGGRNGDLAQPRFERYHRLALNKGAQQVLAFRNDDPALVVGRYGSGRVLIFASTADADWTNLAPEPIYLILLHEAIGYLTAGKGLRRDIRVGEAPAIRVDSPDSARRVSLQLLPDGKVRDVSAQLDRRSGDLALEPVERAGVYRVGVERATGKGTDELLFAANLDTTESNVERVEGGDDAVKSLCPGYRVKTARSKEDLLDQISRSESIAELTSHVAGIMLGVLLAEMYLSNHMRERTEEGSAEPEAGGRG
jgi:hypothetical protein